MNYTNYTKSRDCFVHCLEILSNDTIFCKELLQTDSYDEFLQKMQKRLRDDQIIPGPEFIPDCLELVLHFDKPLSAYKPRINIELKNIHGITKVAVLGFWMIESTISKFTLRPFGGWWNYFKHSFPGKRQPDIHEAPTVHLNNSISAETRMMKEKFDRLGNQCWRQHIDWEDQELGPNVYDEGLHGGDVEPGYMGRALLAHELAGQMLGLPLGIAEYEYLFLAGKNHIQKHIKYDTTPRNLWRLRHLLDTDVYSDIDPVHIRKLSHNYWEVTAFNYLYKQHSEIFRQSNRPIADYFSNRYGDNIKITKKMLDNEFMRCQICFFDEYHTVTQIREAISSKLAAFYRTMENLNFCLQKGQAGIGNEETGLLELAGLIRWLELLHPFRGGNTRHHIILLNKLLVEAGFCPSILCNRNDAPYRSPAGWKDQIITGMLRWQIICGLIETGLYFHLLQIRPPNYIYHRH